MRGFRVFHFLLPLLFALSVSGSGSDLPDDQVEEVLALYRKHCSPSASYGPSYETGGGYGSPSSGSGGWGPAPPKVSIVCKEGRDDYHPPTKKVIKIPASKPQKNIVFVEAPAVKVKHDINLIQTGGNQGRTVVYVLPQKASHALKVWDKRGGLIEQKPQVFFLKNDKVQGQGQLPAYGVPLPAQVGPSYGQLPEYGVPQPQPVPTGPSYGQPGLQVTTFRPAVNYGQNLGLNFVPLSAPVGVQASGVPLGAPAFPAPLVAPFPVAAAGFDPSRLGPEYEIVRADPGTQAAYHKLLDAGGDPNRFQFNVQTANALLDQQQSYSIADGNANVGVVGQSQGKLIFPSESIQSYQYSPGPGKSESSSGIKFPEEGEDETIRDEVRDLFRQYKKEQAEERSSTTTTTTTEASTTTSTSTTETPTETTPETEKPTTKQPERLTTNIFDRRFVQSLIARARNNESEPIATTPSPLPTTRANTQVLFRLFKPDPSFVYDAPTRSQNQNQRRFPSSLKRSILGRGIPAFSTSSSMRRSPGFEIFPAQFVSYSYSKIAKK